MRMDRSKTLATYAFSIAVVITLWEWAARAFGLLVLFPPPSATFAHLARLLADDSLQVELAERGLRQAARFTWEDAARSTAWVYAKALELRGAVLAYG